MMKYNTVLYCIHTAHRYPQRIPLVFFHKQAQYPRHIRCDTASVFAPIGANRVALSIGRSRSPVQGSTCTLLIPKGQTTAISPAVVQHLWTCEIRGNWFAELQHWAVDQWARNLPTRYYVQVNKNCGILFSFLESISIIFWLRLSRQGTRCA